MAVAGGENVEVAVVVTTESGSFGEHADNEGSKIKPRNKKIWNDMVRSDIRSFTRSICPRWLKQLIITK